MKTPDKNYLVDGVWFESPACRDCSHTAPVLAVETYFWQRVGAPPATKRKSWNRTKLPFLNCGEYLNLQMQAARQTRICLRKQTQNTESTETGLLAETSLLAETGLLTETGMLAETCGNRSACGNRLQKQPCLPKWALQTRHACRRKLACRNTLARRNRQACLQKHIALVARSCDAPNGLPGKMADGRIYRQKPNAKNEPPRPERKSTNTFQFFRMTTDYYATRNATTEHCATRSVITDYCATHNAQRRNAQRTRSPRNPWVPVGLSLRE